MEHHISYLAEALKAYIINLTVSSDKLHKSVSFIHLRIFHHFILQRLVRGRSPGWVHPGQVASSSLGKKKGSSALVVLWWATSLCCRSESEIKWRQWDRTECFAHTAVTPYRNTSCGNETSEMKPNVWTSNIVERTLCAQTGPLAFGLELTVAHRHVSL